VKIRISSIVAGYGLAVTAALLPGEIALVSDPGKTTLLITGVMLTAIAIGRRRRFALVAA
jgi:hypothetical protein